MRAHARTRTVKKDRDGQEEAREVQLASSNLVSHKQPSDDALLIQSS